jgi:hypothetical protein
MKMLSPTSPRSFPSFGRLRLSAAIFPGHLLGPIPARPGRSGEGRSSARLPQPGLAARAFRTGANRTTQGIPPRGPKPTVTSRATCTFGQAIFRAQVREDWGAQRQLIVDSKVGGWHCADSNAESATRCAHG